MKNRMVRQEKFVIRDTIYITLFLASIGLLAFAKWTRLYGRTAYARDVYVNAANARFDPVNIGITLEDVHGEGIRTSTANFRSFFQIIRNLEISHKSAQDYLNATNQLSALIDAVEYSPTGKTTKSAFMRLARILIHKELSGSYVDEDLRVVRAKLNDLEFPASSKEKIERIIQYEDLSHIIQDN